MTVVGGSWWQQRGVVGWIVRWSDSRSYGLFWRRERERFGKRGWAPLSSRQKHKQSLSRGVQGATSSGEDQRPADAWEQSLSVLATHSHHLGGFKDTSSVVSPSEFLINCIGGGTLSDLELQQLSRWSEGTATHENQQRGRGQSRTFRVSRDLHKMILLRY